MKLPQITLCTVGSIKYKDQMQNQLDYSSSKIGFGAVKNIIAETNTIDEWNRFIVFELGEHIDTEFALLVHPDGGIAEPSVWRDSWFLYDYVGAPFPVPHDNFSYRDINGNLQRVGNSVSLRSKKLMMLPKRLNMEWKPFYGFYNEDGYIAVNMRHKFEEWGCKFAPLSEAVYFGREYDVAENQFIDKTFTYHKTQVYKNFDYPNFETGI